MNKEDIGNLIMAIGVLGIMVLVGIALFSIWFWFGMFYVFMIMALLGYYIVEED